MNAPRRPKFHQSRPAGFAVLAAAVAAVALSAGIASAQYRVQQNGDALDANNRVGSGGSNGPTGQNVTDQYRARNGNAVVTGNVTGGASFSGYVPYLAPGQFNDFTPGSGISSFQSVSSGVSASGNQVYNNAGTVRPYYNSATTIDAPSGYVQQPYAGGYQPPTSVGQSGAIDYRAGSPYAGGGANALDARIDNNVSEFAGTAGPGGVNGEGAAGGGDPVGPLSLIAPGGRVAGNAGRPISPYTSLAVDGRYNSLGNDQVDRLRSELLRDAQGKRLSSEQITSLLARNTTGRDGRPRDLGVAAGERVDGQVDAGALASRVGPDGQVLTPETEDAERRDGGLRLARPDDQSRQYAQLRDRYDRFEKDPYAEALRPYRPEKPVDAQDDAALPGLPDLQLTKPDDQQANNPNDPNNPAAPGQADQERGPADPPVNVRSLASGVSSPTLKQVYEQAEQLMAKGSYIDAIARYDAAERVVPNQPLTLVGRATAELGAGYYRRSSLSLRRAYQNNPELTMARLDLPQLLGKDRLADVTDALRQRATANRNDPEPTFLLGFIAYNTGNFEQAAAFLDLAQRRGEDPFYGQLRKLWGLDDKPRPQAAPQQNPAAPAAADDAKSVSPAGRIGLPATRPADNALPRSLPATRPNPADADFNK